MALEDMVILYCSRCGELDATDVPPRDEGRKHAVYMLRKAARDHANDEHDGLAVNVGWSW